MAEKNSKATADKLLSRITTRVKPNKWPLNERQRKYIKNRAEGMNKKDAALKAGYPLNSANRAKPRVEAEIIRRAGEEILTRPIMQALKAKGIDDNFIADGILTLSKMTRVSSRVTKSMKRNGKMSFEYFNAPDHKALGKALDIAVLVRGDKAPEEVNMNIGRFLSASDEELDEIIREGERKFKKTP